MLLRKFFLKFYGNNSEAILINTAFGKMLVNPLDGHVSRQLIKSGNYNPQEIETLKRYIKSSDKVLICGAHIGSLAIPLSKLVKNIVAIEASPANFNLLKLNILINQIKNIEIFNFAAAEKFGKIDFILNIENSGGSKRKPKFSKVDYLYDNPKILSVDCFPLDNKLKPEFDVVIMDIEGSEYFAISGMQNILKKSRIFVFEFVPQHLEDIARVDIDNFVSKIPLSTYKNAFLPNLNKHIEIKSLGSSLRTLKYKNKYEDGIILY